ncbi:HdeD family acid-resistance protein [Microbacterium sp.]|uniref:HdeD family acid-resistance protein n=1 Tax=Microbacterium sp. TaxID=51671 RepID=UPI003C7466D8
MTTTTTTTPDTATGAAGTRSLDPRPLGPIGAVAAAIGKTWWALLIIGIAWIVVGFVLLRFDESTPAVLAIVFGVVALLAAVGEIFRAAVTTGGWRVWHIVLAVILLFGAISTFVNPEGSFVSLVLITGFYFVFAGTFDIISSLFAAGVVPGWWLQLISGILEIILGIFASSSFESSAIILVTWFSFAAIFRGVSEVAAAFTVRGLSPR